MHTQLQQLIKAMKADLSKAYEVRRRALNNFNSHLELQAEGCIEAFEKYIPKLTKILNEGCVAAPADKPKETKQAPGDYF